MRKRELVFWGLPLCSIIYGILSDDVLSYLNVIILLLFAIMVGLVVYDGTIFLKNQFPRKKSYPKDIPELKKLANKIGLELSPQPFWEKDKEKMTAMSLGFFKKGKKIIFGKSFLPSLTNEERVFVGGHEFFHLYGHEFLYYPIIFVPILGSVFLMQMTLNIPLNVMISGFLGATIGCICFGKRSFEFIADLNGVAHVNRDSAVSALEKAYVGKTHVKFYLHPSLKARIKNLDRIQ